MLACGLIVGESLVGIVMAAVIGLSGDDAPFAVVGPGFTPIAEALGCGVFMGPCALLRRRVLHGPG